MTQTNRRRPVEAIESRNRRTSECEERVRKTVTKLAKTGLPFTVEEVCRRADVGKTFIYDKRRPELTKLVLGARDISQQTTTRLIERADDANEASWRERAINAEGQLKQLRARIRAQDGQISDLTGQLFDPEGTHLADENAHLRSRIDALNLQLTNVRNECSTLQRSLQASRSAVKREQERNIARVHPLSQRFDPSGNVPQQPGSAP